ncbi:MAG TPA: hypothetical protein VG122_16985 [Gemmata sp.]|nr:hypothetical protein [Gemmata sp.]
MAILIALPIFLILGTPAHAQSEASPVDKLIDLREKWLTQIARQDVANWEADLISSPRTNGMTVGTLGDPNAVLKELRPVLTGDYLAIRNGLVGLTTKANARRAEVQKDWTEVCRQRATFRQYTDKQQEAYGFNFDAGTPPGFNPNAFDVILLGCGIAVLVVAMRLRAKERRLAIRKANRAAVVAALLIGLAMFPGCDAISGDRKPWIDREQTELTTAIKDATEKADAATNAANAKWQATVDGWAKLVTAPTDSVDATVQREEIGEGGQGGLRDRLRGVALESHLAELIVKDTEDQRNKLSDERSKLNELVEGAKWRSIAFASVRIGIVVFLFGITIAPFWTARRARRAAIRLASRTCPRCFRRDTLKVEKTGASSETKSRYRGAKAKAKEEPAHEENEDTEVRCTKCGLRMRRSYLKVPRLCFPTVGVRSSGKTHMLVTAYDRIRKRTAPTTAVVQPAPSGSDIDKRFDRLIDEILHRRGEAGATDLVLPDPILVHLKDQDPAGGNPALINLFDYSGELINPDVDVNQLKATAVRMDGFMLFLDPTQLYGDGANVTLDEQLGMLDQFLAHMRKERKVPVGGSIPVPVAVCIPKFDLLVTENPIGGQSIPFIRHLLEHLNPSPREMTLDTIQARSDLVEEMLPLLFTGADVRRIVEGYFGKQVMFFPMSSVGLFEHELGIKDLSRRTIAPFGVAEPLVWLLHMYGYEVFG